MMVFLKFSIFVIIFSLVSFTNSQDSDCVTSKDEKGVCINIKQCEPLLHILRTQYQNPDAISYLQKETCGYEGVEPLVCCPRESSETRTLEPPITTTTTTTTIPNKPSVYTLPKPPSCGNNEVRLDRVVNGQPATLGEFPWVVALGYKNTKNPNIPRWLCGGSLITDKHVLTAGHCVNNRPDLYLARLGELDLFSDEDGAKPVDVLISKAKLHEKYSASSITNDIAVLTLEHEVSGPHIQPICLPMDPPLRTNNFVRHNPLVAGWGALYFNGPSSSILQVVALPVVSNDECRRAFVKFRTTVIDERVLCAGYLTGGKDACQGDSGGPLMLVRGFSNYTFYQIGVVSYGFRCAEEGYPGVYTRVTHYIDWIQNNLN